MLKKLLLALSVFLILCLGFVWIVFQPFSHSSKFLLVDVGSYRTVIKNQEFTIDLASNPTTGYTWKAEQVPKEVELKEPRYHSEEVDEKIGGGGFTRFQGSVQRDGEFIFQLSYLRDWEGGEVDSKFQVKILVEKKQIKSITVTRI